MKHECESGFGAVIINGCHLAVWKDNHYFCTFAKVPRFGRDLRFVLIKVLVPSLQTLVQTWHTVCSVHRCYGSNPHVCRRSALCCWFGVGVQSLSRSVQNSGVEFQPERNLAVAVMGEMIAVEFEEEARFFLQRMIFKVALMAAMFYTSKELDDPPNGRFWTLTPDGDVHPDTATGLVWLDGKNQPF